MFKNKIFVGLLLVGLLLSVLIFSGCGVVNQPARTNEPIKIGVVAPLTGEMAIWGESIRDGAQLAVAEINQAGGIKDTPLKLVVEDNKACDNVLAVSGLRKLIDVDKVQASLIGCSGSVLAAAPVAEEAKVILMVPGGSAAAISQAGDYIFRTTISDSVQAKNLAQAIVERIKIKKLGVLYVNNSYGAGFFDNFKQSYSANGGEVLQAQPYDQSATDFRTQLLNIKTKAPDGLLIICYGKEGGLIAKQARSLGIEARILGTDNFGTAENLETGGAIIEGAVFSTELVDETRAEAQQFKNNYLSKYGKAPPLMMVAADAYDGVKLLAEAIKIKGYDATVMKDYLYGVKDYKGASGQITMDKNGDADKAVGLQMIKNGQFVNY